MATLAMATSAPGNTNGSQTSTKARAYLMTLHQRERWDDLYDYLSCLESCSYILCCEHDGPSEPHYHVYCQFKTPMHLSVNRLCGAHVEVCMGSAQQNIRYCKALDDKHLSLGVKSRVVQEDGKPRLRGGCSITVAQAREMSKEDVDALPLALGMMVNKIQSKPKPVDLRKWFKQLTVVYIEGPSGIGKSKYAMELCVQKDLFEVDMVKYQDGFWHNVSGDTTTCIYDDWRPSHMSASEFIAFIDYNRHPLNVKGGTMTNNYEFIVITSVIPLNDIYRDLPEEPRRQWERRVTKITLYPKDLVNECPSP